MNQPNFSFEKKLWRKGFEFIAGVDEVGRGCFAGPVVAGTVVFSPDIQDTALEIRIDDSKKLTKLQREKAEKWIKVNAITWGIGEVSAKTINRLGMASATKTAFRNAITQSNKNLNSKLEHLLIDAFFIPYVRGFPRSRQNAIVNGDEKSISIASASIIAKVYRDKLMEKVGSRRNYEKYAWVNNKGYATRVHREAILNYGITGYHRKQFVDTFLRNQ